MLAHYKLKKQERRSFIVNNLLQNAPTYRSYPPLMRTRGTATTPPRLQIQSKYVTKTAGFPVLRGCMSWVGCPI